LGALLLMLANRVAAVRLLNLWLNGRLAAAIGSDLSCDAYKRTLYQPYAVHVQHNSSGVITGITTQTLQLVTAAVVPLGFLGALLATGLKSSVGDSAASVGHQQTTGGLCQPTAT
jgi:ATP-binding cassette subfamily B protein